MRSDEPAGYLRAGLHELIKTIGVGNLAKVTGIARQTLHDIANNAESPSAVTRLKIAAQLLGKSSSDNFDTNTESQD